MPKKKKTETTFWCQHPPKMVDFMFFLCVYYFCVGKFLDLAYFELFLCCFPCYTDKKLKVTKNTQRSAQIKKDDENKAALELNFLCKYTRGGSIFYLYGFAA